MSTVQEQVGLDEQSIEALRTGFRGEVIAPDDAAYDDARTIWNGAIDRRPAVIARCAGVADVIAAVKFARERGLLVAVRGGGHSFPGHSTCDGGIVIDLGPMRGIWIDPSRRVARAEAGVLWGELDHETQAFGLATTGGIVTHTGIAGLTLGGGIGWLMRKCGLTIDNLLSADVVTASGEFVRASADENADLFWGLRGGGGNFGIVTSFSYRLHPVGPTVLAGPVFHVMDAAPDFLRFYREWITQVPDEVTTIVNLRLAPPLEFVPTELHGKPVIAVVVCYAGDVEEGQKVVAPLKAWRPPAFDLLQPKPYVAHQAMFDPTVPHGNQYYFKSCDIGSFSDEVIDVVVDHASRISSPLSQIPVFQLGAAVAAVGDDEMPFGGRTSGHTVNINGVTEEPGGGFTKQIEWARGLWDALQPHTVGTYVNFLLDEGEDRIVQAYGRAKYDRLRTLKAKYDPDNLFRLNQNIPPA